MQGHVLELGRVDHPVQECNQRLQETENPYTPKIQLVSSLLRNEREKFFTPVVVSIGPMHRKDAKLQEFEKKKKYILDILLERSSKREEIYISCKQLVQGSLDTIKECYSEAEFDDDTCDMIVNDALFILSFSLMCLEPDHATHLPNKMEIEAIKHDLALVENQIPLFILNEIFQCVNSTMNLNTSLVKLLRPILAFNNPFEEELTVDIVSTNDDAPHILGLLHLCCKPCSIATSDRPNSIIYSAVYLVKSGVNFKPKGKSKSLMGMEVKVPFLGCVTVEIPKLSLDGHNESVFRNLIAFEQQYAYDRYFTSYVYDMTMLASNKEDVDKLVDSGIIVNHTHSNEQAVSIIKDMLKNITYVDSIWKNEWKTLYHYCNDTMRAFLWRSCFNMSCFSTRFSRISTVMAVITFALVVVVFIIIQTK